MLLQKWPGITIKTALSDPKLTRGPEQSLRPFSAGPKFDILVTVVNPDPQAVKIEWNLLQVMDGKYLIIVLYGKNVLIVLYIF